jgi:hypothetical protein
MEPDPMDRADARPRIRPLTEGSSAELTAEADRFAHERISAQFSTEPVNEPAAEDLLRRAYAAGGLEPPGHIHWLDGPLELVAVLAAGCKWVYVDDEYRERVPHCVWDDTRLDADEIALMGNGPPYDVTASIDYRLGRLALQAEAGVRARMVTPSGKPAYDGIKGGVWSRVVTPVWRAVRENVGERLWRAVADAARCPLSPWVRDSFWGTVDYSTWHSIRAYDEAPTLAQVRFYDEYFKPNQAGALARLNELVSGYWLGRSLALLVRRPRLLALDSAGRLHGETAPSVEYLDGWGFWAWHGVEVPEKVIVAPEELTRDDFLYAPNVEARRIIQERMGERFVPEIGGAFVDSSAGGVLYAVDLPGDPDRVAHYLQVQDPSTGREYYLRVPPDIATAEAALAWTFGMRVDEYRPARES